MADLIEILESFNRKERFFLLAQALYDEREEPKLALSEEFRKELKEVVGVDVPKNAFVAFDYHLDWVHASLVAAHHKDKDDWKKFIGNGAIRGNQEDVDLLVAFREVDPPECRYHLLFLEAKGYNSNGFSDSLTGFQDAKGRGQLKSKSDRLKDILKPFGEPYTDVVSYFVQMTGNQATSLADDYLFNGSKWLKLNLPCERLVVRGDTTVFTSGRQWKGKTLDARKSAAKAFISRKPA